VEPEIAKYLDETERAVRAVMVHPPSVGVVLGTGLGSFVDRMRNVVSVPCSSLPHMPGPRTRHNAGNICFGVIDDAPVVCLQGRSHLYEGHPPWQVVHGVRLLARLGIRSVLLTDSCGGLDPSWTPGTMMVVTDHLDFGPRGMGSLAGPDDDGLFTPISELVRDKGLYDALLASELHDAARSETLLSARIGKPISIALRDGIYAAVDNPASFGPAHARMLHALGANAVGAGIAPEAIALRFLGVRVAALATISWVAAPVVGPADESTSARLGQSHFERVVRGWVLRAHRAER
jgi:purine-nucleoside phosphorylase